MNVLVTGGAGFLGAGLIRHLLAAGSLAPQADLSRSSPGWPLRTGCRRRRTWPPTTG